jgi:hypothetical protein
VTPKDRVVHGLLRRLAASDQAAGLVLRGGVLLRHLSARVPRPADDLDLLALDRRDLPARRAQVEGLLRLPVDDGVAFGGCSAEEIWADTPAPGVRFAIAAAVDGEPVGLQLDVGAGDPLVPPPRWLELPGPGAPRVLACAPETLFGWKVHGLYERGLGRWRAKDLHDAWLLAELGLDPAVVPASLRVAFESRGFCLDLTDRLVRGEFARSRRSARKWRRLREGRPPGSVPDDLAAVVARVGAVVAAARATPAGGASRGA